MHRGGNSVFRLLYLHLCDREIQESGGGSAAVRELCDLCGDLLLWAEHHQELQEDLQGRLDAMADIRLSVLRAEIRVHRENSIFKIIFKHKKR